MPFSRRHALALSASALFATSAISAAPLNILVVGGTGSTGSEFAKRRVAFGDNVTVFARPTSQRDKLAGLHVDFATGDVLNEADIAATLKAKKYDIVFIGLQTRRDQPNPYVGAMTHITKYAKQTGVKQIVWIGQVGASAVPINKADYPDINFELFAPTLKEMSAAEKILVEGGVPYTVIRVGALIVERGKPAHPPTGQGRLVADTKAMGPITYGDLAELASSCVTQTNCMNKIFHALDDTLAPEYAHWRCRRFAAPDKMDAC